MSAAYLITAYAFIGWLLVTCVLAALYWFSGLLGRKVFTRLKRIYHLTVIGYWLDRLESEGTHVFEKFKKGPPNE